MVNGFTMKLADARINDEILESSKDPVELPGYMPPEYCENQVYTAKGDVWGLGVLIYEVCAGDKPID